MPQLVSVTTRGVGATISRLRMKSARLHVETRREMDRIVIAVRNDVVGKGLSGAARFDPFWGKTGGDGDTLSVRSGKTRRSVLTRVFDVAGAIVGVIGTREKHMKLHESGGTITGNPYLRIPTAVQQTAAGVDRLLGASARTIPGGFILRSKAGNLWIATSEHGRLVLRYLLKRSVTIRARHIFGNSLRRMKPFIQASLHSVAVRVARA